MAFRTQCTLFIVSHTIKCWNNEKSRQYTRREMKAKPIFRNSWVLAILICILIFMVCIKIYNWLNSEGMKSENEYQYQYEKNGNENRLAIVSMMKAPKNIETWLRRHRDLGVSHFYIRLEDSPEIEGILSGMSDVTLKHGTSAEMNEYDAKQDRQNEWVNEVLKLAPLHNIDWVVHIDSDEILIGDLSEIFDLPTTIRTFWMQNLEAKFEDIPRAKDNCFVAKEFVDCSKKPKSCAAYGNGKGGARIGNDVRAWGPHRFKSSQRFEEPKLKRVFVEHYESCDFDMYKWKYTQLAKQDREINIPFPYYKEAIDAAKVNGDEELERVFRKYRVV